MDENFGGQPDSLSPKPNTESDLANDQNPSTDSDMGQNPNTISRPMQSGLNVDTNNTQDVDPIRPMEKASDIVVKIPKEKKKKTGLILGIIIGLILLVGVAVAVFFFMQNNSDDPVSKAVGKIMRGEAPKNVAIDGAIEVAANSEDVGALTVTVNLKTQGSVNSLINTTSADVNLNFKDLGDINFSAEELYPSNGDLYIKVNDISTAVADFNEMAETYYSTVDAVENEAVVEEDTEKLTNENTEETDGALTESLDTSKVTNDQSNTSTIANVSSTLNSLGGILGQFDGKWIKISLSDFKNFLFGNTEEGTNCSANLISDIKNSGNTLAQIYGENPFIFSTSKDVTLASKNSKVYQVVFDSEKMNAFVSGANNTNFANNYKTCNQSEEVAFESVNTSALPNFYVELDNDYNFTRFYTSLNIDKDGENTLTADINFSYPIDINVSEPENATDFMKVIQTFFNVSATDEDIEY